MLEGISSMSLNIIDVGVSALITGLSVFISGYAMFKIGKNSVKKEVLDFIQSEKAAKMFYQIGGIVAQGAKQGFGLNPKQGKFSIEGMIGQLAGRFIEQKFLGGQPAQPQAEQPQQTQW